MKYRNKLVLISILLVLSGNLIYFFSSFLGLMNINNDIETAKVQKEFDSIYYTFMETLYRAETVSESVCFPEATNYVSKWVNLLDPSKAKEMKDAANSQINRLNISSEMFQSLYLLGVDMNQKRFAKYTDNESITEDKIPCYEDLKMAGLEGVLNKVDEPFVFYKHGELTQIVKKNKTKLSEEEYQDIIYFTEQIEGSLLFKRLDYRYKGVEGLKAVFVKFNNKFLPSYLKKFNYQGREVYIVDQNNTLIGCNSSEYFEKLKEAINNIENGKTDAVNKIEIDNCKMMYRELGNYGLKLIYVIPSSNVSSSELTYFLKLILISLCSVVLGVGLALFSSYYILYPIRRLTLAMRKTLSLKYFKNISESSFKNILLNKWSFKKKLLGYFIISTLIPLLLSGVFYAINIFSMTTDRAVEQLAFDTKVINSNIQNKAESMENLVTTMSISNIFSYTVTKPYDLTGDEERNLIDQMFKKPSMLADASYFVLVDKSGGARYQSIFFNTIFTEQQQDLYKFSIDVTTINALDKNSTTQWITNMKDIFGKPTVSVIQNIEKSGSNTQTVGYLQMVLSENIFRSATQKQQLDIVLLDSKGNTIFNSTGNSDYIDAIESEKKEINDKGETTLIRNVAGIKQMIVKNYMPQMKWNLFVFQRMDDFSSNSQKILRIIITIIIFICLVTVYLAWKLSKLLVKPMEIMESDMKKISSNNFESFIQYEKHDEIGALVKAYNEMIYNIKHLINENINSKTREQELMILKTQAELNMLQQQINPHFLYNTLEAINMRVMQIGEEKASSMIVALSQIFRFSTRTDNKVVLVHQELEHVKNYIKIQEMRFKDKFVVEWDIQQDALDFKVLKLIIQPLVENTINHGLYDYSSGGVITISVKRDESSLIFEVKDNGVGMCEKELKKLIENFESDTLNGVQENNDIQKGGIALQNINRRLKIYYKGMASMTIESKFMRGTIVRISIPQEFL